MVVLVQPSMATVTRNNGDTSLMSGCGRVMQSISAGLQQNIIIEQELEDVDHGIYAVNEYQVHLHT